MGPSVNRMLTIYSNSSAPLNKMTAMPIYDKRFKNLLSEKALKLNLVIQHCVSKYTKFVQMMTIDLFMIWSNLCPSCCGNTG